MASSNTIVRNNIPAMNVHRNMSKIGVQQFKASERLASGYRINRASDDAAGLAISEKMRGQIRGLNQASSNVSDAISLISTAEGGMQGIGDMIHRIRELVDYAANDTQENNSTGTGDRQKIQDEIDALISEIDSMSSRVEFNKKKLIDGSFQDTKQQLANAKALYDSTGLAKTQADTKVSTIRDLLGNSTDSTTGGQVSAMGDLNDAETAFASAITQYKADTKTFATAEAKYLAQENAYKDAKRAFENALGDANLSISDIQGNSTLLSNMSDATQKAAILAAAGAYNTASKALGLDELGLSNLEAGTDDDAITAFGLTTADIMVKGTDVEQNRPDATANIATGGLSIYAAAKAQYATDTAIYQAALAVRDAAQSNVDSLNKQLDDAKSDANSKGVLFNAASVSYDAAQKLDNANASKALHFQVGANGGQSLIMSIGSLKTDILGIGDGNGGSYINVAKDSGQNISSYIDVLDQALSYVTTERSKLGAAQNRMEYTQESLDITSENLSDAESRIRDTDMAKEMMNYTKANILQQAAVSMMAQANQRPQSVLQLLQ